MEAMEEAISPHHIPSDDSAAAVVKGKRTKRQRLLLLPPPLSTSSPMLCGSLTEEEEDMANCLILLAMGSGADSTTQKIEPQEQIMYEAEAAVKFRSRRLAEAATTTNGRAGFYVYECKTCNKCFPSFQALGGHRASHKKRKLESKEAVIDEDSIQLSINSFPAAAAAAATGGSNGKPRVHECSICGSEFSSGQALGGHMRRHRPASFPETPEAKKERSGLPLDLNLPAPTDEDSRSCFELPKPPSASTATAFSFTSKAPLLFSSSALVDCHY